MLNINVVNKIYRKSGAIPPMLTCNSKLILSVLGDISTKAATYKELMVVTGLTVDKVRYCKELLIEAGLVSIFKTSVNGRSQQYVELN